MKIWTFYTCCLTPAKRRQTQRPRLITFPKTVAYCRYSVSQPVPAPSLQTLNREEFLAQREACACSTLLIICKTHTSKAVIRKHGQCTMNLFLITQLYFGLAIKTAAVMNLCGCRWGHIKNELCTVGCIPAAPASPNSQNEQDDG